MSERRRYSSRMIRRPTMTLITRGQADPEQTNERKFDLPFLTKMDSYVPPILDETGEEIDDAPRLSKGM
jgi:hypothetical protein